MTCFASFIVLMKFPFIFASYNSKYWVLVIYFKYRVIIFFISFSRNGFLQMIMRKFRLFWNLYHQPRDQRKQKTALFIMTKQREGKRKKKKRGYCCFSNKLLNLRLSKVKTIDLFAISRKRFCLYEFSDNGHKIRNRNFINIPNLRKLFLYIWNIYEMYWTRKVAFHVILEKEANFEPLVELETFFESIFSINS